MDEVARAKALRWLTSAFIAIVEAQVPAGERPEAYDRLIAELRDARTAAAVKLVGR